MPPVKVENVYLNILPEEFYSTLSKESCRSFADAIRNLLQADKALGCVVHTVKEDEVFEIDEISFHVLRIPDMKDASLMNMNDSSVVYKLTVDGGQTILFLGDGEWVCNNDLMSRHYDDLKSDVVQVEHHGVGSVSEND